MGSGDDPASAPSPDLVALGRLIKSSREGRFTVQELARRAGVSPGLLSQIERGRGNPSFRTLHKLSNALGLRIGDLLQSAAEPPDDRMVVRRSERKRLQLGEEGLTYQLVTPGLQGRLEMLVTSVPAGFDNRESPFRHVGEECVLLLEGSLDVTIAESRHSLGEGDSITFDSGLPHWWRNGTKREAVIVGAVTPPSF